MRAVLEGFAGVAPRSVVPNLIELLGMLLTRASGSQVALDGGAPKWMQDILISVSFLGFLFEMTNNNTVLVRVISSLAKQLPKIRRNFSKPVLGKFYQ